MSNIELMAEKIYVRKSMEEQVEGVAMTYLTMVLDEKTHQDYIHSLVTAPVWKRFIAKVSQASNEQKLLGWSRRDRTMFIGERARLFMIKWLETMVKDRDTLEYDTQIEVDDLVAKSSI